jgi:hypothetical protein
MSERSATRSSAEDWGSEHVAAASVARCGPSGVVSTARAGFSAQQAGFTDSCFSQQVGAGAGSASEQHDFLRFGGGVGLARRDSTSGRTCSGGSIPFASAQRSFSSSVKQQQSPAQHAT